LRISFVIGRSPESALADATPKSATHGAGANSSTDRELIPKLFRRQVRALAHRLELLPDHGGMHLGDPSVSATFTTIAFDDSSLRRLEIST
jgi:hypothetical protein